MMEYRELKDGERLEVGDIVYCRTAFGNWKKAIYRVTKTTAFVKLNEVAEGKFTREYGFNFGPKPSPKWETNTYEVYRKI